MLQLHVSQYAIACISSAIGRFLGGIVAQTWVPLFELSTSKQTPTTCGFSSKRVVLDASMISCAWKDSSGSRSGSSGAWNSCIGAYSSYIGLQWLEPLLAPVKPGTSPVDKGSSTSEAPGSATELPNIVGAWFKVCIMIQIHLHTLHMYHCFYRNKVHLEFFRVRVKYRI